MSILSRKGKAPALYSGQVSGPGLVVLMAAGAGGGGGGDLLSLSEAGQPELENDITLSEGAGITLTQVGQNIEIAVT